MTTQGQTQEGQSGAPPRLSWPAFLGWIGFSAALAWIVLVGGSYAGIDIGVFRLLSLSMMAIALVLWALLALRRPEWRPRTAVWPALLIPFGALVLTTLSSPYPRLGLDYVAWNVMLIAMYLLLARVAATGFAQRNIGAVVAFLSFVVSGVYLALIVGHWLEWWDLLGRLSAPMLRPAYTKMLIGGPTIVAPVMVLLLVSAAAGVGLGTARRRVTLAVLTLMTLMAVFLSGTRGAWLAFAAGIIVVGLVAAVMHRDRLGVMVADRRVRLGVIAVAVVGGLAALVMAPALLDRLTRSGDGGRAYYLDTALRMFEDSPLVGGGPGSWAARRLAFTEAGEPDIYVAHPHNVYAGTLADAGLVGLLAGAIALGAVLWLVLVALRSGDAYRGRWAMAGLFVLVYLAVAFLVDSFANLPVIIVLAALPFAFLDAASPRGITDGWLDLTETARHRVHAAVTVLVFVGVVVAVGSLVRIESVALDHQRAVAAIDDRDWPAAVEPAEAAVVADPDMVPYLVTRGIAAAAADDWETARSAFRTAAAVDDLPQSWLNLALARLESGAPTDEVMAAIENGLRVGTQHPSVALAAGYLYARLGMDAKAEDVLADLLVAEPSLAGDPNWATHPSLGDRFEGAYAAALARAEDPWELRLMRGDIDGLGSVEDDSLNATITQAWTGDSDALIELQTAAIASPRDDTVTTWAARALAKVDDAEEATRFRRIIAFDNEGSGYIGLEMRIGESGGEPLPGAVATHHIYGENGYRRATPDELLVPGLPVVVPVDLADLEDPTELDEPA